MALLKSALIRAVRVFDFRRTEHSLFATNPTIPRSCTTRAVIQCAAKADEIADELARVGIDYERCGTAAGQLIVGVWADSGSRRARLSVTLMVTHQSQLVPNSEGSHAVVCPWSGMIVKHPRSCFAKHGV